MKLKFLSIASAVIFLAACNSSDIKVSDVKLENETDSLSYCLGLSMGEQIKRIEEQVDLSDIDLEMVLRGIKDQRDSTAGLELNEVGQYLDEVMERRYNAKMEVKKKPADEFMANNKNQPGVMSTGSGLQYKVIQEGTGIKPVMGDSVVVQYVGKFDNGTEFESTRNGQPARFALSPMMVEGFNEGLQLMSEGSKYMLYIPWNLGYGKEGNRGIEPYSNLVFEITLEKVIKTPGK